MSWTCEGCGKTFAYRKDHDCEAIGLFDGGRYPASDAGIDADFSRFDAANPHVFKAIVELCRQAKARGYDRWSIKGIFEVLRWNMAIHTDEEAPKLNNNYTALYARKVMRTCPDLEGFFETRERTAGEG